MKVRQGGVPGLGRVQQGQETITLVPHVPCHSDPEEELVTITTQATPGTCRARDKVVVQAAPDILVTDISASTRTAATQSLDSATLAGDNPHYTTTACVPHGPPPKPPTALRCQRGVAARQGYHSRLRTEKHTHNTSSSSRAAATSGSHVGQGVGVLEDSLPGQGDALTPSTLTADSRTTLTAAPQPALPASPAHDPPARPCGVGSACSDNNPTRQPATCSFCSRPASGIFTVFKLQGSLPHSGLDIVSLLRCLGLTALADMTLTSGDSMAMLCPECCTLLQKGDQAYHHVMEVAADLKQRCNSLEVRGPPVPATHHSSSSDQQASAEVLPVPATHHSSSSDQQASVGVLPAPAQGARRLRLILPKPMSATSCVLCGAHLARPEQWQRHSTTYHRLSPRWRSPRLQAALRLCVAKELQEGSGLEGARCCPACTLSFSQQQQYLTHLRAHHSITVDDDFLACVGGAEHGTEGQWRGRGRGAWMGKEEEVEVVVKEEIEEDEEMVESEELIKENETTLEDGEQEREMEEEAVEEEEVEEEGLRSRVNDLMEEEQTQPGLEECDRESEGSGAGVMQSGGGGGPGRGARWGCRVCAAVFPSQQEHDTHKTAAHPGSVRIKRGTVRPAASHQPVRRGRPADGIHQDQEQPAVACQEGAIVILERDGQGGVTHHRLQPSTTTDVSGPPLTAGAVRLPCPVCSEVFGDRLSLVRHQRAAHPQAGPGNSVVLVECPLCGRRLAGSPALTHHMARVHHRSSHPPLRYRCRLCLSQCHTRPQLERHMQERHGGPPPPPPVQCGRCGKTYSARYIDKHLANIHGDLTRFPCAFCPMKFGTRAALRGHVSLEHANTTWTCQDCPLQFAKYHQLRQHHLYVHSRAEHRCPLCPRSFKRRGDLTEHTKRRHQERQPLECSFCPKVYSDRKRLRIHLMRKHSVAWEDTLARGYARRQRENNCLRRRRHQQHQQQPHSPPQQQEEQQAPREDSEGCQGGMLSGQPEYSVVHLTEAPHPLTDTISYIILEET